MNKIDQNCTDLRFLTHPKMEAELAPSWSLWGFEGCLSRVSRTSCVRACTVRALVQSWSDTGFTRRDSGTLWRILHTLLVKICRENQLAISKHLSPVPAHPSHLSAHCELLVADSAGPSAWIQGGTGRLSWCFHSDAQNSTTSNDNVFPRDSPSHSATVK